MIRYAAVVVLLVASGVLLDPPAISWVYVAGCIAFEAWLVRQLTWRSDDPVLADEPPYHFNEDEARLVGRYRFYFRDPASARHAGSVLAALGLTALLLAPWLTYKHLYLQAAIIGINLFAVARLTRRVAPASTLRLSAARGGRDALRMLEAHDPAWAKIRAANEATR